MKISKEKFNKLNQLDRIEFRQRYQSINDQTKNTSNSTYFIIILSFLSLICGLVGYIGGMDNVAVTFFELSNLLAIVAVLFFIIDLMLSIWSYMTANKKLKELESEYFKIEIKKRSIK